MHHDKEQVIKNLVDQAVYANFNAKEREHIDIDFYKEVLVEKVDEILEQMVEEMAYLLSQKQIDPDEDSQELREADSWETPR